MDHLINIHYKKTVRSVQYHRIICY